VFQRRCGRWFGRQDSGIRHRNQNSIRVASGSTEVAVANHKMPHQESIAPVPFFLIGS
jgi:hypothetical protein